jgi:Tfp pilus assembly protein PilW
VKLSKHRSTKAHGRRSAASTGYSLVEVLIASALGLLVLAGGYAFLFFALRAMAGVSTQTVLNQKGGNAIEFIQSRVRFATTNFASSSGNTLTLGFDNDCTRDSDGDGRPYDDRDRFEQFKFIGNNSTNIADCATNLLVYISNTNSGTQQILISGGVRNLPGYKVFFVTNNVIVLVRFGIVDPKASDHYQAIDLQASAISLNRFWNTNVINIMP